MWSALCNKNLNKKKNNIDNIRIVSKFTSEIHIESWQIVTMNNDTIAKDKKYAVFPMKYW